MYKNQKNIYFILSNVIPVAFLISAVIYGMVTGEMVSKVSMAGCITASIVLCAFQILSKVRFKCIPFILLLGIYICLRNITGVLAIFCVYTLLDDIWFSPCYHKYKNLYIINREIDKRNNI